MPDRSKEDYTLHVSERIKLLDRPTFYIVSTAMTALLLCGLVVWGFSLLEGRSYHPDTGLAPPGPTRTEIDSQAVIVPSQNPTQSPIRFPARSPVPIPATTPRIADTPMVFMPLGGVDAIHRDGQTFLTWSERVDLHGERYRIYRSSHPIRVDGLNRSAVLLAEVSEGSANFYANRYGDKDIWQSRYADRLIVQPNADPIPSGTGLFIWTVHPEDFTNNLSGEAYYAVTLLLPEGMEYYSPADFTGPIFETVADPSPIEITGSPGVKVGEGGHVYIQYMDYRQWNPSFHAPNATNDYLGFTKDDPVISGALAYAYDYVIYGPTPETCRGSIPESLPVLVFLHGWRGNRYSAIETDGYPFCGYGIFPFDESETWYFGFARNHDYRLSSEVEAGDVIENYTEQRILRMIYDLLRKPPGPAADPQRIYVAGHSMGGSGALAFAQRYPNVFAAAYSAEPITNYLTAGVTHEDWAANAAIKWGNPQLNLPVIISASGGWADHLQKYNGVGVWDWQNYADQFATGKIQGRSGDEMAPFGMDHGIPDHVITWGTEGKPIYSNLSASRFVWAGSVTMSDHEFSDFIGLPPSMAKIDQHAPFWDFQVIRGETIPGLSKLSGNPATPIDTAGNFNQTVKWSSSWDPWDGIPLDQSGFWQMSFCSVAQGTFTCGSGTAQTVDITPRRLQGFKVTSGAWYDWENRQVSDNSLVASGNVKAGDDGLLTIPGFLVSPSGNRLIIRLR